MRFLPALVVMFLVAACGSDDGSEGDSGAVPKAVTPTASGVTVARDVPSWIEATMDAQAGAGVDEDENVVVVTLGSSTNPHVVSEIFVDGQTITVTVANDEDAPATMDLVPTTSTFALPTGVAADQAITIVVGDHGAVEVGPELPDFAWIGASRS